jgi:hypothetical protein
VTEARDGDGVFFPLHERVALAVATDPGSAHPRLLVELVREGTLRHCGGHLADDTTIFAVRLARPAHPAHPSRTAPLAGPAPR